jgi:uncharacterized protein YraI
MKEKNQLLKCLNIVIAQRPGDTPRLSAIPGVLSCLFNLKSSFAALAFGLGLITMNAAFAAKAYTASDLNVRTGPATEYDRIGTLPADSRVDVIDCKSGWCLVHGRGLRGWVSSDYLARGEESTNVIVLRPEIYISPGHYYRPHHWRPNRPHRPRPRAPKKKCKIAPGFPCPR